MVVSRNRESAGIRDGLPSEENYRNPLRRLSLRFSVISGTDIAQSPFHGKDSQRIASLMTAGELGSVGVNATFGEDLINDMISRERQPAEWPDALLAVQTAALSPKKLNTLPRSRRRSVRRERPLNMLGCMALLHAIRSAAKADKR